MTTATLEASASADRIPLDKIDVSNPDLYRDNAFADYFRRLRKEDPVHYCAESAYGPYWSVTKYNDIMHVDTNHQIYSSDAGFGGIVIDDNLQKTGGVQLPNFIAMDPPRTHRER